VRGQDNTISSHTHPWSFIVREHVQCLCEGGRKCAREDPSCQRRGGACSAGGGGGGDSAAPQQPPPPVEGLHCNWVGGSVLAMARPWQDNVEKFDVVAQFKNHNIGLIINLQEVRLLED
jgi:protein tyrosine phosphatase domain-containing protein 1